MVTFEQIMNLKGKRFDSKAIQMIGDFDYNDKYSFVKTFCNGVEFDGRTASKYIGKIIDSVKEQGETIVINLK